MLHHPVTNKDIRQAVSTFMCPNAHQQAARMPEAAYLISKSKHKAEVEGVAKGEGVRAKVALSRAGDRGSDCPVRHSPTLMGPFKSSCPLLVPSAGQPRTNAGIITLHASNLRCKWLQHTGKNIHCRVVWWYNDAGKPAVSTVEKSHGWSARSCSMHT